MWDDARDRAAGTLAWSGAGPTEGVSISDERNSTALWPPYSTKLPGTSAKGVGVSSESSRIGAGPPTCSSGLNRAGLGTGELMLDGGNGGSLSGLIAVGEGLLGGLESVDLDIF